jgi:hypothetical protein
VTSRKAFVLFNTKTIEMILKRVMARVFSPFPATFCFTRQICLFRRSCDVTQSPCFTE